jgi:hypothetical protein
VREIVLFAVQRTGNRPDEGGDDLDLVHNRWKAQATGATNADGRFAVRGFLGKRFANV